MASSGWRATGELFLGRLHDRNSTVRHTGPGKAVATCPGHDDHNASLSIEQGRKGVILRCHAGCKTGWILECLDLRMAQLFDRPAGDRPAGRIVATYDYRAVDGASLQKVRREGKRFSWRAPDSTAPNGYRSGLGGRTPRLYRHDELLGSQRVFLVEGEKAADALRAVGLVATCGHAGAGTWRPEWTVELYASGCREPIILADRDRAGQQHGEHAAGRWCDAVGAEGSVRLVNLPSLPPGGDVVDFLDAGGTVDELTTVVDAAAVWSPTAAAEERARRRRELQRVRMQRHRERARGSAPTARPSADEQTAAALEAIVDVLAGRPGLSFNAVWRSVKGGNHSRRAVERALALGETLGTLTVGGGGVRGRASTYYLSPGATGIPGAGRVTPPGHFAPASKRPGTLETIEIANKHRVSHHPVTLCAVTQPVRTSGTLQESSLRAGSGSSVTGDRDSRAGDDRDSDERDSRDGERSSGICCGEVSDEWRGRPYAPACRLCPKADVYWRRAPAMTDSGDSATHARRIEVSAR